MEGSSNIIESIEDSDLITIHDTSAGIDGKVSVYNLATHLISSGYVAGGVAGGGVSTTLAIGSVVNWAGHTWIVVHVQNALTYLAMKAIYSLTQFGAINVYNGSYLAAAAKTFENSLPSATLLNAVDQTVEGVTAKIFVPTYTQCNGGFDYYKTQSNRVAYYGGSAQNWWTSTGYNATVADNVRHYMYYVGTGGMVGNPGAFDHTATMGFRPHIALRL